MIGIVFCILNLPCLIWEQVIVVGHLLVCVFWQRVAATRWELSREETRAIRAQEVASASASSGDTTATGVWCGGKNPTQFRCVASL